MMRKKTVSGPKLSKVELLLKQIIIDGKLHRNSSGKDETGILQAKCGIGPQPSPLSYSFPVKAQKV